MAKRIVDEILKYTIEINGDPAQKELIDLEKQQRKLTSANKDLRAEKERMQRDNLQNTKRWKEVREEMAANNRQIKLNETQMAELRGKIGITALTMKQLKSEATRLRLAMNNMVPGSEQYLRYQADLNKVNARMRELRVNSKATGLSIGRVADKFNRFAALGATVIATVTGMVLSFQKMLDFSGKLSDAQADVSKTTGLSAEAVDDLTAKLGLFKTRSARLELLALAEEAGRLGKKSTEDILEFVKTGDKIKVALGDDLKGDVNDNIRIIGKLTEQYRVGAEFGATFGEGMEMIGSAINEVSASGTAQADYLVDFLSRMVGISQQAGIAAEDMVGVAAVLDEAGQQTETSATALSQVIVNMSKDIATYAEIAGVGVQEFADLVKTDTNEALLLFLKGLNGNNEGLTELANKFADLGIDGNRAITVLAALAGQTDKVREKQQLASKSLNEATSLTEEAKKKNENFGAVLDNLRKRMVKLVLEGGFVAWLQESVTWIAKFVGAIDDADGSVTAWREKITFWLKVVIVATTALFSYQGAIKLVTLWNQRAAIAEQLKAVAMKGSNLITGILRTTTLLYQLALAKATGNMGRAAAAQRMLNATMLVNPYVAIATVLASVVVAYALFSDSIDKLTVKQRVLNDLTAAAQKSIVAEKSELERLLSIVRDETIAKEKRLQAMKKLQAIAPDYLGNIELDEINTLKATKAINAYVEALDKKALAQAFENKRAELNEKLISAESESLEEHTNWFLKLALAEAISVGLAENSKKAKIAAIKEEIAAFNELYKGKIKSGEVNVDGSGNPTEVDEGLEKKQAEIALANFMAQLREKDKSDLQQQLEDKIALAKQYGFDSVELERALAVEIARQNPEGKKKAEARKKAEEDLQEFLKEINQGELSDVQKKYESAMELLKKFYSDETQLAQAQNQLKKEIEAKFQEKLKVEKLQKEQEEREAEFERKKALMESSMQQMYEYEQSLIYDNFDAELQTKEDLNEQLRQAELQHLERLLDARRSVGLDTIDIEKQLTESKLEEVEKRISAEQKQRESAIKSATTAAFSAASQAKSADEAKNAILNAIRDQIAGYIAEAIAKFVADQIKEQGWLGLVTGAAAGAAAGALFSAIIPSFDGGMYDVIDDKGDRYRARRDESMPTGLYTNPTVSYSKNMLVAEKRPEIVIDGLTTQRLMNFRPDVIDAIRQESKGVRGYQNGNYPDKMGSGNMSPAGGGAQRAGVDMTETNMLLRALLAEQGKPALALLPDNTVKAINDRNSLEHLVREQSIMNG